MRASVWLCAGLCACATARPIPPGLSDPLIPGPADDYRSRIDYGLPVRGEWTVANGGPTKRTNHHVGNQQQWYAYDLLVTGPDGKSCTPLSGQAPKNSDCLAFGRDVVAPADGTVVMAVDGVPDNVLGEEDTYFTGGNTVELDHGGGEYSFLCHFEPGSIVVRPGQRVAKGEALGKVGNSGNSTEPHVHWQLASDPAMWKGHGLPIRFLPLQVNGEREETPHPLRGDRISEPLAPAPNS